MLMAHNQKEQDQEEKEEDSVVLITSIKEDWLKKIDYVRSSNREEKYIFSFFGFFYLLLCLWLRL